MAGSDEGDVPRGARTAFWALVLVFNVALLVSAIGVMLVVFRGDWTWGGLALAVGAIGWALGLGGYVWTRRRLFGDA